RAMQIRADVAAHADSLCRTIAESCEGRSIPWLRRIAQVNLVRVETNAGWCHGRDGTHRLLGLQGRLYRQQSEAASCAGLRLDRMRIRDGFAHHLIAAA